MPDHVPFLKGSAYAAGTLLILFFVLPMSDLMFQSCRMTSLRGTDGGLGITDICANLLKGDYTAASEPIARKTGTRELNFADTILWLARKGNSPFKTISGSQLFTDLPKDLGPLKACSRQAGFTLQGDEIFTEMYLDYPNSMVRVSLRYSAGLASRKLKYITIGGPEPLTPGKKPDETDRRMAEFMEKMDQAEAAAKERAKAPAEPAARPQPPAGTGRPQNTKQGFVSRYGCLFPLPDGFEGDSRFHGTETGIELVMLYPEGMKELAWTAFDKLAPAAIGAEIVPLRPGEMSDPLFTKKAEAGLEELLKANGWKYRTEELKGAPLKGFITRVEKPGHVRVRLYGKQRLYKFTSTRWDARMQKAVNGFREKAN